MELAVIKTGGKQYLVQKGTNIYIEKLPEGLTAGDPVTFEDVLMTDDGSTLTVGTPMVKGKSVKGTVIRDDKGIKKEVVRYKAKSRYLKRRGHRQPYLKVQIDSI